MMSCRVLPLALVLLCSSILCSLGCNLNQGLQEEFFLLNHMSMTSLRPCLKDRTKFNFPKEAIEGSQLQRKNAIVTVHEMLQQTLTLFCLNTPPAAWNQTQLTLLLLRVDQQMEHLERCLGQNVGWQQPSLRSENIQLALKSYFQGISQYLQAKRYSLCAWEIVRIEIRRLFLFMKKLIRKLRN
ncbi:interferon alpha-14-like [Dromiciops gliroides]|uniref:interferon alpha-14-like n=1 Tax=Dromiciops gliroides TaxID=33562 RepID=UPI001CC485F4|nr:interferon alpha-14-like [Dromiciops gliroides]